MTPVLIDASAGVELAADTIRGRDLRSLLPTDAVPRVPNLFYAECGSVWGHRKGGGPGEKDELFFGYYLSLATMVADEGGAEVPELVRLMNLVACDHDPVPPMVDVLVAMVEAHIALDDVVVDSGYARRVPEHFALPLRAAGATLVMDLQPSDRGTQGTHQEAICHTATATARPPPRPCSTPCRSRGAQAKTRWPPTTGARASLPATSSGFSAPPTPTATTASPARQCSERSAVRCAPTRSRPASITPKCSPHPSTRRSAAPRSPSPCRHR